MTIELKLLGPVQVVWGEGKAPRFRSPKALALLGYLAAEARPVSRDHLVGLFWADDSDSDARGELRRVLHNLSTILPGCLEADRRTVRVRADAARRADTTAFRELQARGDAASLAAAVELYRGEFMEGLSLADCPEFETWLLTERERWRQAAWRVLDSVITLHVHRGEFEPALHYASRLVSLDAWREEAHVRLMLMLAKTGQREAALRQFETCRRLLADELGVEPSEQTRALYERIRAAASSRPRNLPPQPTPFIGRQTELVETTRLLADPHCRLLTIVGPGGVGKTRLAIEAAARRADTFLESAVYVSLAAVTSAQFLVTVIAEALGVRFSGNAPPKVQLIDHLRSQELLLLLDNFEHLMAGVDLVVDILREASDMKILVTSREKLNLREEWLFELDGLPYPPAGERDAATLAGYDAVQLFAQNARRVRRQFDLDGEADSVTRICRLLAGSPLGLELAAALTPIHSCAQIAADIARGLDALSATWRNMPERHRSLRAVFEHSWRSLTIEEQSAFRKLSVFRGGFTFDAARLVAGMTHPVLDALVAKSLLRRIDDEAGSPRYDIHEILRQYAAEMLDADPDEHRRTLTQHADYYAGYLSEQERLFASGATAQAAGGIHAEIDNIRAAWQGLVETRKFERLGQAVIPLHKFYESQSWFQEGIDLFARARIAMAEMQAEHSEAEQAAWARLHLHEAGLLIRTGSIGLARERVEVGLAVVRRRADAEALAFALNIAGSVAINAGEFSAARAQLQEALALYRQLDQRREMVKVLANLGNVAGRAGDYAYSIETLGEGLSLCREIGDRRGEAFFLNNLATAHLMLGNLAEARTRFEECLPVCEETGNVYVKMIALQNLGELCLKQTDHSRALSYCEEAVALARRMDSMSQLARGLKWLVLVRIERQEHATAWGHLREGLLAARASQSAMVTLDMLEAAAVWLLRNGERDRAVDLLTLLVQHPATEQHTRENATRLLIELGASAPSRSDEALLLEPVIETLLARPPVSEV